MATKVTVHDEGTRQTLESALWLHAQSEVWEDGLYNELRRAALDGMCGKPDATAEVDATTDMLTALRTKVEEVRSAAVGSAILLDMPPAKLTDALEWCRTAIEEDEHFWEMPGDRRLRLLANRDAAARLLRELAEPAEAVA